MELFGRFRTRPTAAGHDERVLIESADRPDRLLITDGDPDPRTSRMFPAGGERLLHADLHNHTRLSDGDGRAQDAFASMRAAGLDVAAITDHAFGADSWYCIDEQAWRLLGELADAADDAGGFVAVRGFEWSSPSLGHMNVWGSRSFTLPLPLAADGAPQAVAVTPGPPDDPTAIAAFYDWLAADPQRALASFNHPGREDGRFGRFRFDARLVDRVVGLEMFNRGEDYLFERVDDGAVSPLVECLDAGWRVGLMGVTDEHGTDWGFPADLGRTGIWARGHDRAAFRRAMAARRIFATRERGLRVDAAVRTATALVPMGSWVDHDRGDLRFVLDVAGGPDWAGRVLRVQVLQTGRPLPVVVAEEDVVVPAAGLLTVTAPVDRGDGDWVVLRLTDPAASADRRARPFPHYSGSGRTLAYLSPFFLDRA
jgi:hypothetical protein